MFCDKNANGVITQSGAPESSEVTQENHYYSFGMAMENVWYNTPSVSDNKYTYNAKEYNDDFGLNWSDYGARFYDPAIGRWHSFDPMAEKMRSYSPYNYVFNNPMRFIDPDGMQGEDWVKRKDGSVVNDVNVTNDQQAVKNHGDGATSLGQSFTAINDKNEQISFNSDGTTTSSTMLSEVVVSSAENNVDKGGQANDAIGLSNDLHGGLMGVVATIDKTLENLDGFKTVGAAIDVIGRASGIVGAVQSVSQAIDNPTVGNILKAGLDIGLAAIKANPIVGIVDGVLSVTGVKDAAFKWVDGKVENYSVNKFLETQKVNTSNVQVK